MGVGVGGTGVAVGDAGVSVGGTGVSVGGTGVSVGASVGGATGADGHAVNTIVKRRRTQTTSDLRNILNLQWQNDRVNGRQAITPLERYGRHRRGRVTCRGRIAGSILGQVQGAARVFLTQ